MTRDRILPDVDIAIDGKTIVAVGDVPPDFAPDETIDGRDYVALPAFFNAHIHAAMTLERGWAEDLPFDRWLNEKIWVAESALEAEDVYWGAALAAAEMVRSGTVGFADHYFWMDQVARAVEESGVKALLAWCHFGIGTEQEVGAVSFEDTVAFVEGWQNAAEGRIHTIMGPHSPYMVPPEVLRRFVDEAHRVGVGAHFHLSESSEQVRNSLARHGKTPPEYVAELGLLDLPQPSLLAHCNAVTPSDMALIAEKGAFVAHAPKTYQKLGMEMPPLREMLASGMRMALGTDGPASNSDFNMLEIMRIDRSVPERHPRRSGGAAAHAAFAADVPGVRCRAGLPGERRPRAGPPRRPAAARHHRAALVPAPRPGGGRRLHRASRRRGLRLVRRAAALSQGRVPHDGHRPHPLGSGAARLPYGGEGDGGGDEEVRSVKRET